MLGNGAELHFLGLHEDEQAQSNQGEGQLVAGIGDIFDGFFRDADQGGAGEVVQIENIHKGAECIQQGINKGHAECDDGKFLAQILLSLGFTLVFQEAYAQNADHNDDDGDHGKGRQGLFQDDYTQQAADRAGGVLDGVGNGLLQKPHSEIGKGHGYDIQHRYRQIDDQVNGIVANVLRQQGKDGMGTHDNTHPDANLQMGIFFIGQCAFFVKQFCGAPQKRGCDGKE